jgi:regulatory protein
MPSENRGPGGINTQVGQKIVLEQTSRVQDLVQLRNRAYKYLARREYSRNELLHKLKPFDQYGQVDQLLQELVQQNAQSDQRFAEQLGRTRVNAGKGSLVLEQELKQHKIDSAIIEAVMQDYDGEWRQLAEKARVKKFGPELPTDYKEWARQARFLQQRGFSPSDIPEYRA